MEVRDGLRRTAKGVERRSPGKPGQRRVVVANTKRLQIDVGARREHVVDLAGDVVGEPPLPVGRRAVGEQQHHFVKAARIGGSVDEVAWPGEKLPGSVLETGVAK